jgi:dTDP-4-amino-4,6-dideoxygalactose transaminase
MTPPAVLGGTPAFPAGLPLARPEVPDIAGVLGRIEGALATGRITNGALVRELEERVADGLGVGHAVAVSSCTAGLMLVLRAVDATGPVAMPSFTFPATAHAAVWVGGTPVWADVDEASLTLAPSDAALAAPGASALVATHVFGTPCDVEALQAAADEAGVPLVADAAHGLGSRRGGVPLGRFGTAEVFSLSPTKIVLAGEGGIVATGDDAVAEAVRLGRDYGNPGDYDCLFPGLNARMSELHAAVALASFAAVDETVARRNSLVAAFAAALRGARGARLPAVAPGDTSTWKDLTVLVDAAVAGLSGEELARALAAEGVDTRRYYVPPVHRQKAYAGLGPARPLPVTDRVAEQVVTVPLWTQMDEATIVRVADAIGRICSAGPAVRRALAA